MILTKCAACAAPLAHDAPRCVRCKTRYCNSTCQHDHWRRGRKQICKRIHRGGNAEQYHADNKYKEAVAVAVEACAADTKGQTCYICTEAVHWKTKEGLVRICACRGTAGFAHVSCLAEQAKILVAEAWGNNLGTKVKTERFRRWDTCSLCEQEYHGVMACVLGWACWKTYRSWPEGSWAQMNAMRQLGNGLTNATRHEDALSVREAELSMDRRLGVPEHDVLMTQGNLASTYRMLNQFEKALQMRRDVYVGFVKLFGEEHEDTLKEAGNNAILLLELLRFEEAKELLCKVTPVARRVFGAENTLTLSLREDLSRAILDGDSSPEEKRAALEMLKDTLRVMRRVLGLSHPETQRVQDEHDSHHRELPRTAFSNFARRLGQSV